MSKGIRETHLVPFWQAPAAGVTVTSAGNLIPKMTTRNVAKPFPELLVVGSPTQHSLGVASHLSILNT